MILHIQRGFLQVFNPTYLVTALMHYHRV